ncbi:MAG: folate-binding protein YgfZ [Candidatus Poriferisodalaceae bacterium]|jgi:folate-binding protein YgfZ
MIHVSQRDIVAIDGPEAVAYLHGQITQSIEDMTIGESRWSFSLEPRGNTEAFFRITRTGEESLVVDCDAGHGEAAQMSMAKFKLRTKAEFVLGSRWMVSVRDGAAAPAGLGSDLSLSPAWPGIEGTDLLLTEGADRPALADAATDEEWNAWRIAHGQLVADVDVPIGGIPNETQVTSFAASFTKGCYRGQELVERIDSRGAQRLVMRRLQSQGDPMTIGPIVHDGTEVGNVTSVAGQWALGFVRGAVEPGAVVTAGGRASVLTLLAD